MQPLPLAKECHSMKLGLHTNATVLDDATKFAELQAKQKLLCEEPSKQPEESVDYNDHELTQEEQVEEKEKPRQL
jgi:hypothetical protein